MKTTSTMSTENFFTNAYNKANLSDERKNLLLKITKGITTEYNKNNIVNLNFICTHNSRRSQLSQVWGFFASEYFNLNINSFSGGTETTAFFKNTVKTLQSVGFKFDLKDFSHQNPKYIISFEGASKSIFGFSKRYDNAENQHPFIAITTCNNADTNCPFIPEASERFHLPFVDPKSSDDTELQDETYLKTNLQIAGEIYFIFSEIKKSISI